MTSTTATPIETDADDALRPGCAALVRLHPVSLFETLIPINTDRLVLFNDHVVQLRPGDIEDATQAAVIDVIDDEYWLTAATEEVVVAIDDRPVHREKLDAGNVIRLGTQVFKFLAGNTIESQFHEAVYEMLTRDGMTSLYNKQYFHESLVREIEFSQRYLSPIGVILVDVDHFKSVNDRFGHLVGDEVLRGLGSCLRAKVRRQEVVARFGGEEFTILVRNADIKQAIGVAERLRNVVERATFVTSRGNLKLTVSAGVAHYTGEYETTANALLEAADQRLYVAKHEGRNRVRM